jgi:hypothetical protein
VAGHSRRHYRLRWDAGPVVVIDLYRVGNTYMLRYEPPLRQTLRRAVIELPFTPDDFDESVRKLRKLVGSVGFNPGRGAMTVGRTPEVLTKLAYEGELLLDLVLSDVVGTDLAGDSLFVEIDTDEVLLPVPWELMCSREGFICLRHAMGRYVNLRVQSDRTRTPDLQGDMKVLILCVPQPQPSVGDYERLREAESEYETLTTLLLDRGVDCVPLRADEATKENVIRVLRGNQPFTIIHFTGHGHIDVEDPRRSGLVLFNGILTTGVISQFVRHSPVLAFINGCETARTQEGPVSKEPDQPKELPLSHLTRVFGIARPFLDQGSYVLGTRWRVGDSSAARFARSFYEALLDGDAIGKAIMKGRNTIYAPESSDLSWASYVFYGDPRLVFQLSKTLDATESNLRVFKRRETD